MKEMKGSSSCNQKNERSKGGLRSGAAYQGSFNILGHSQAIIAEGFVSIFMPLVAVRKE
jgi:hypothetical protein